MQDFFSLGISKATVATLKEYGIGVPTPIQTRAIPIAMEKKDVIAQAQTGTGKTLAFVLPILEKLDRDASHIQALIVTPTRELALQITEEIEKLISDIEDLDVLAVYGGQDVEKQLKKLKKQAQIIVGTPGRLLDHIRRETIDLSKVSFLVLDEADQMLHIGFLDEVEAIIKQTPESRQTMLFSATIPAEIRKLSKKHMHEPVYIQVEKTQGPATNVNQIAIHTTDRAKQGTLIELIEMHRPFLAVIFCRTKRRVSKLCGILKAHSFLVDELHGDLSQAKREQVMKRFRNAEVQLLVATDVAARGLDIEGVTHVFNYDIPLDSESYVHRIGRTGRAGMKGLAITFYSSDDRPTLDLIERELNITIKKEGQVKTNKKQDDAKKQKPATKQPRNNDRKREYTPKSSDGRNDGRKREHTPKSGDARKQGWKQDHASKSSDSRNDRNNKKKDNWKPKDDSNKKHSSARKSSSAFQTGRKTTKLSSRRNSRSK